MKKLATILLLSMIATVAFCGCGNSNNNSNSSASSTSATSSSASSKESSKEESKSESKVESKAESSKDESSVASKAESVEASAEEGTATTDLAFVGVTWKFAGVIGSDGNVQTAKQYCEEQGLELSAVESTYVFNEDGTAVGSVAGVDYPFTYTVEGNKVTLTSTSTDPSTGEEITSSSVMMYDEEGNIFTFTDEATGLTSVFEQVQA